MKGHLTQILSLSLGILFGNCFNSYAESGSTLIPRRSSYCAQQIAFLENLQNPDQARNSDLDYVWALKQVASTIAGDFISEEAQNKIFNQFDSDDFTTAQTVSEKFVEVAGLGIERIIQHFRNVLQNLDLPSFMLHALSVSNPALDNISINPWKDHLILGPLTNPDINIAYPLVDELLSDFDPATLALRLGSALSALRGSDIGEFPVYAEIAEMEMRAEIFIALIFKRMGKDGIQSLLNIFDEVKIPYVLMNALRLVYLMETVYPGYLQQPEHRGLKSHIASLLTFPIEDGEDLTVRHLALQVLLKARTFSLFMNPQGQHPHDSIERVLNSALIEYRNEQHLSEENSSENQETDFNHQYLAALYMEILLARPEGQRDQKDLELANEIFNGGMGNLITSKDDGSNGLGQNVREVLEFNKKITNRQSLAYLLLQKEVFKKLGLQNEISLTDEIEEFVFEITRGVVEEMFGGGSVDVSDDPPLPGKDT